MKLVLCTYAISVDSQVIDKVQGVPNDSSASSVGFETSMRLVGGVCSQGEVGSRFSLLLGWLFVHGESPAIGTLLQHISQD